MQVASGGRTWGLGGRTDGRRTDGGQLPAACLCAFALVAHLRTTHLSVTPLASSVTLDHLSPKAKQKNKKASRQRLGFTAHEAKQGGIGFKSLTGSHTMRRLHAVVSDPFSPQSNLTASHLTSLHLISSSIISFPFPFHLIPSHPIISHVSSHCTPSILIPSHQYMSNCCLHEPQSSVAQTYLQHLQYMDSKKSSI